ncbi:hypothetical protein AC1031_011380, partial [Aphanomyces cochlioides]
MDEEVGFRTVWKTVLPFFQKSRVEVFKLKAGTLDLENIAEMVQGIEAHPTLRELIVYGLSLPFAVAKHLVETVSPAVRRITIGYFGYTPQRLYSQEEVMQLKTLASKRSIKLTYETLTP